MIPQKHKVIVEVPHRISGFFEIVDEINGIKINNPERIGSRGAGFNLNSFGRTEIIFEEIEDLKQFECQIYINNEELNEKAETTYFIFNYLKKFIKKYRKIKIFHTFDLPVGCGYGASGSGALGTVYGLDYLLNLGFSFYEKGRIAHIAEVINKTGLGTVCGQLAGGLCILKEPGYPCNFERISIPHNLKIICGSFGIITTKSILSNPELSLRIKEAGNKALTKLKKNPNIETFASVSNEFVNDTSILNILNLKNVKELIENLNQLNIIGASMNQLGRSVYAICKKTDESKVLEVFECYLPKIRIFISSIRESKKILLKRS
ncbi:MAG: pantoate kinase [Candidatus Hermodarchaeota archaeon]